MTRTHLVLLTAATIIALAPAGPAEAGGSVAFGISNHGISVGFGTSNWGIWGSSWDTGGVAVGFSATLAGYGEWVRVDGLGQVWRPWVAAGWQPYTHGRWVWTSMGWTWVAYEPWGWVPHHYGNWAFSTIGWVWSPGYTYHPGNVVWVSSGGNVGWYPCAPRGWSHFSRGYQRGWNTGYATGRWDGYSSGYADGWRDARYATWVPWSKLDASNVASYAVRQEVATHQVARARVTAMAAPPTRSEVERRIGRPIPEARVVERKATIDGHQVRFVRPEGQANEVMRHGAETIDRALAPAARNRVRDDVRSADRPQAATTRRQRRPEPAVTSDGARSSGSVQRIASSSPTYPRPSRSAGLQSAVEHRTGQPGSAIDRSRSGPAPPKAASTAENRTRTTRDVPARVVTGRTAAPVRSAPRVQASAGRSSSRPPVVTQPVGRVRSDPSKGRAVTTRQSGSRPKPEPAKEQRRTGRREKN